jgi:hypothetical protein
MAGTYIGCIAHDDDAMNVVRHDDKAIEVNVREVFGNGRPCPFRDTGDGRVIK